MKSRVVALLSGALVSLVSFTAAAAPTPATDSDVAASKPAELDTKELTRSQQLLHASIATEIAAVHGFLDVIASGLATKSVTMSPRARAAYNSAKALHREAKLLNRMGRYRPAYDKVRAAYKTLGPAMAEVLEFDHAPAEVQRALSETVSATADRVGALKEILEGHTTPQARAKYARAKAHYSAGKLAWRTGRRKAAFGQLTGQR